jgi:hypothetical protein
MITTENPDPIWFISYTLFIFFRKIIENYYSMTKIILDKKFITIAYYHP